MRQSDDIVGLSRLKQHCQVSKIVRSAELGELKTALAEAHRHDRKVAVMGNFSKTVFGCDRFEGLVAVPRNELIALDETKVTLGSGLLLRAADDALGREGLINFNVLRTIPGTVGGALTMNASFQNETVSDSLLYVEGLDYSGSYRRLKREDLEFSYRRSNLSEYLELIWTATFEIKRGAQVEIEQRRRQAYLGRRKQPAAKLTLGSTFKNTKDQPAYELVRATHFSSPAFEVAAEHANFLIFRPGLSGSIIQSELKRLRRQVAYTTGIRPEFEIVFKD